MFGNYFVVTMIVLPLRRVKAKIAADVRAQIKPLWPFGILDTYDQISARLYERRDPLGKCKELSFRQHSDLRCAIRTRWQHDVFAFTFDLFLQRGGINFVGHFF